MAKLKLENIEKIYPNQKQAVFPTSLDINDGEFIVILGPSGCGKSTLLRMVAGLEKITRGEVFIDDVMVNKLEPAKRDIAMVFQNYALYPHMSVRKNIAYCLKNFGYSKPDIEERLQATAKLLQLDELLERKPFQLSGGQRQRVAMGRAIVRNPKLFLFDEPLSNLDAKLRTSMRLEIRQLQEKMNTTCLYVTHDQVEAMTMADRLVVMNDGRIEQIGTPLDVYENPASLFVADFLGSPPMNMIEVIPEATSKSVKINDQITLQMGDMPEIYTHKTLLMGIRPEHIAINQTDNDIPFNVGITEKLGADTILHGKLTSSKTPLIIKISSIVDIEAGDNLNITLPDKYIHFFDPKTGKNIKK